MRPTTRRDDAVKAAFDRFHATARTDRKRAVTGLHEDMQRAGGPVPQAEDE